MLPENAYRYVSPLGHGRRPKSSRSRHPPSMNSSSSKSNHAGSPPPATHLQMLALVGSIVVQMNQKPPIDHWAFLQTVPPIKSDRPLLT